MYDVQGESHQQMTDCRRVDAFAIYVKVKAGCPPPIAGLRARNRRNVVDFAPAGPCAGCSSLDAR